MNPPMNLTTISGLITPQPYVTSTLFEDDIDSMVISSTTEIPKTEGIDGTEAGETSTMNLGPLFGVGKPTNHSGFMNRSSSTVSTSTPLTSTQRLLTSPATLPTTVMRTTTARITTTQQIITSSNPTTTSKTVTKVTQATQKKLNATKSTPKNGTIKPKMKPKAATKASSATKPTKPTKGNMTAESQALSMNSLADLDRPENLNLEFNSG